MDWTALRLKWKLGAEVQPPSQLCNDAGNLRVSFEPTVARCRHCFYPSFHMRGESQMVAGMRAYIQQLEGELLAERQASDERLKEYHAVIGELASQKEIFERHRENHVQMLDSLHDALQDQADVQREEVDAYKDGLLQLKTIERPCTPQSVFRISGVESEGSLDNLYA
eukprot:TRINITY_DN1381_c0_g1_i1.p1 TRINITY_DN1381_c0_g1~~TRINITY_DN1381_c0_g1_i1.p1  ORF type:complete len:168 (-),score=9.12 TRINITY_DN1381_c0_g1_i1:335-838(-)